MHVPHSTLDDNHQDRFPGLLQHGNPLQVGLGALDGVVASYYLEHATNTQSRTKQKQKQNKQNKKQKICVHEHVECNLEDRKYE